MRRASLIAVAAFLACLPAAGQFFNFGFRKAVDTDVTGRAHLEPKEVVAGEPCAIILELEVAKEVGIEEMKIGGLPDADGGRVEYGAAENMADGKSQKADRVVKRIRLPARFFEPCTQEVSIAVQGMAVVRRQQGGMSFTSSSSFGTRLAPFTLKVDQLPQNMRPTNFSGAIGSRFRLVQTLSPDHVHPGDLVTATYKLSFDGYCPSNIWPTVDRLSKEFRAYDPKEVSRSAHEVVWTQVLVPQTAAATNSAFVSLNYYNVRTKRYEVARSVPQRLVFVSDEAASTENTAVVVTAEPSGASGKGAAEGLAEGPVKLRFAPSEASPVVVILPAGTPLVERARSNGWRRMESPRGIGWTR